MSAKILTSTLIGIDNFLQDPITSLLESDKGTLAVLSDNIPIFYVLTPQRLKQLLFSESLIKKPIDVSFNEKILMNKDRMSTVSRDIPTGKFAMYHDWKPDNDFQYQAAIWGIILKEPVTSSELAAFISYWKAEGRLFHHVQWQQKLARSVQMNRFITHRHSKYCIPEITHTDYDIPDGFRGE